MKNEIRSFFVGIINGATFTDETEFNIVLDVLDALEEDLGKEIDSEIAVGEIMKQMRIHIPYGVFASTYNDSVKLLVEKSKPRIRRL